MNADQNNRTNRDQENMSKEAKRAADKIQNASGHTSGGNESASRRADAAARRREPSPARNQSERSPKQENL